MSTRLHPITVSAPGFRGLNTEQTSTDLDPSWATAATNCVIDAGGRIAARKGWTLLNETPITNTPDVEKIHEYLSASGASTIVSAAGTDIFTGTTSLTTVTGSLSITNNDWKFQNHNTKMVGFQDGEDPIWWDGSGNFELLHGQISDWTANTAYAVGDVVKAVGTPDLDVYFHCTVAGTTHASTEPTWPAVGSPVTDNTVTWTTRSFPKGNTVLSAFGRIWCTDANGTTLHYSDLLIPYKFSGGSAGSIDLFTVWPAGQDEIIALEAFNNRLVIFGKRSIVIYGGPDDPDTMSLVDTTEGIGCIARDSVQIVGTDILFLSNSGIRSLGRTIQEESAPLGDVTKHIRTYMSTFLNSTVSDIQSVYSELEGFYLLTIPVYEVVFCLDMKEYARTGQTKVTLWDNIKPKSLMSALDNTVYIGQAGYVAKYDSYTDNASAYVMDYAGPWMDFGSTHDKMPKRMRLHGYSGAQTTVTFKWAFDYTDTFSTVNVSLPDPAVSEYNVAEYNIDEYSSGISYKVANAPLSSHGKTIRFGLQKSINGSAFSMQRLDFFMKMGSLLK